MPLGALRILQPHPKDAHMELCCCTGPIPLATPINPQPCKLPSREALLHGQPCEPGLRPCCSGLGSEVHGTNRARFGRGDVFPRPPPMSFRPSSVGSGSGPGFLLLKRLCSALRESARRCKRCGAPTVGFSGLGPEPPGLHPTPLASARNFIACTRSLHRRTFRVKRECPPKAPTSPLPRFQHTPR